MTGVFRNDDLFEYVFEVGDDVIEVLAEVTIKDQTLHLKDIAVYPRDTAVTLIGVDGVLVSCS